MTVDEIIANLEEKAEKGIPMSPQWYLEQAQKLSVLIGNETDLLHKMQKHVAQNKVKNIEEGKSVAEARLRAEAGEVYEQMLNQKSKCERIVEIIRIAKIQSRMRESEMFGSNV